MILPINLTLNSILVIAIGLGFIGVGIWLVRFPGNRLIGVGLIFTGLGNILLGVTNGFNDWSPRGNFFFRAAVFFYLVGVPALGYSLFKILGF